MAWLPRRCGVVWATACGWPPAAGRRCRRPSRRSCAMRCGWTSSTSTAPARPGASRGMAWCTTRSASTSSPKRLPRTRYLLKRGRKGHRRRGHGERSAWRRRACRPGITTTRLRRRTRSYQWGVCSTTGTHRAAHMSLCSPSQPQLGLTGEDCATLRPAWAVWQIAIFG